MRNLVRVLFPMVVAGAVVAGCSSPEVPGDDFNLSVHNPTPAAQSRTGPTAEPAEDPYNRTVPLP